MGEKCVSSWRQSTMRTEWMCVEFDWYVLLQPFKALRDVQLTTDCHQVSCTLVFKFF